LLRGGYKNRDSYHLLELAQPSAREKSRFQLQDRQGDPIKAERVTGRGEALFLLRNREIFKLTVEDANAVRPMTGPGSSSGTKEKRGVGNHTAL